MALAPTERTDVDRNECDTACWCGGAEEPSKSEDVRATKLHRIKLEVSVRAVDADDAAAKVLDGMDQSVTLEYIEAGVAEEEADW